MDNVTIYTGHVPADDFMPATYYWVDDRCAAPTKLNGLIALHFGKLLPTDLMANALKKEKEGYRVVVSVRDMYYETPEE